MIRNTLRQIILPFALTGAITTAVYANRDNIEEHVFPRMDHVATCLGHNVTNTPKIRWEDNRFQLVQGNEIIPLGHDGAIIVGTQEYRKQLVYDELVNNPGLLPELIREGLPLEIAQQVGQHPKEYHVLLETLISSYANQNPEQAFYLTEHLLVNAPPQVVPATLHHHPEYIEEATQECENHLLETHRAALLERIAADYPEEMAKAAPVKEVITTGAESLKDKVTNSKAWEQAKELGKNVIDYLAQ